MISLIRNSLAVNGKCAVFTDHDGANVEVCICTEKRTNLFVALITANDGEPVGLEYGEAMLLRDWLNELYEANK